MSRLWPATRILLLLAAGVVVTDVPGWATAVVLAGWLMWWGWRDDVRWECAGPISHFVSGSPWRWHRGDVIVVNEGRPNERNLVVVDVPDPDGRGVHVRKPGRWTR